MITVNGEFEDRWYVEVDLGTESSTKILDKCRRYHQYYGSGIEQKQFGIFPLVVWLVPDETRKINLKRHMEREFAGRPNLFTIIVPDELEARIKQGAEGGLLC